MLKHTLFILLSCFTLCYPLHAHATRLVGQATFSVLWFDVYHASLFHPSGTFSFNELKGTRLELNYLRNIERDELVKRTREQWQKMDIQLTEQHEAWLQQLKEMWPNLKKGDSLLFEVAENGAGMFEFKTANGNYQPIGAIVSLTFSTDFLAIWLAERQQNRAFRRALLGSTPEE